MAGLTLGRSPTTRLNRNPAAAWRHLDVVLMGAVLAVASLGVLMVYSATRGPTSPYHSSFLVKQGSYVVIGTIVMLLVASIDYRMFRDFALVLYGGSCALLVLVVSPVGSSSKGAQAWFQLGSFQMQPSEFAKFGLICMMAAVGSQFRGEIDLRRVLGLVTIALVPLGLIMLQPDLGTGLVLAVIAAGVLALSGAPSRYLLALLLVAVLGTAVVLQSSVLAQYQKDRLTSFLDQEQNLRAATYNLNQSKTAIGAGGAVGQGLFEGSQTRLGIVPEQHTDFIFTAVGEQLGFLGSGTLLAMFGIMCWRIFRTAQLSRDPFGTLACVGVLCMFMFQIFENAGMTMGIMPVTGIPLPFMSYGGSSTIASFAAIGLVVNIHSRRFS